MKIVRNRIALTGEVYEGSSFLRSASRPLEVAVPTVPAHMPADRGKRSNAGSLVAGGRQQSVRQQSDGVINAIACGQQGRVPAHQ